MKKNIKNYAAMLMMAVAVMGGMTSCEEHTDEFDGSLRSSSIATATRLWSSLPMSWAVMPMLTL